MKNSISNLRKDRYLAIMLNQNAMYKYFICGFTLIVLLTIYSGTSTAQNLVSNPGFETGKPGELPHDWTEQKENGAEGIVVLTDKMAHSGKQSLFIEHTNDTGYIHPNKSVEVESGDYFFRFRAMSHEDIEFHAQIYRIADWSTPLSESCSLKKGQWTKFEFPFSTLEPFSGSIQIGLTEKGSFWLDDVELIKQKEAEKAENVKVWDTIEPFANKIDLQDSSFWENIPEGSDPLTPQGDVVLENGFMKVVFWSKAGKVAVHSKSGTKRVEFTPLQLKEKAASIKQCILLSNDDNEAQIEADFTAKGVKESLKVTFRFSRNQIMEIKPAENVKGMSIQSPISFAIVPNFIGDDLIFAPDDYPDNDAIYTPSDNVLLGLLDGKDSMIVITWPEGSQEAELRSGNKKTANHLMESVDFENDSKAFCVALLEAQGIWHREELKPEYLERPVAINWKRPFPAKWVTQLYEGGVKTRYTFKESESKTDGVWRAGIGWHTYPVCFNNDTAYFHLSKKIPPKEQSIIYFVERKGTSVSTASPVDIMKQTLDEQTYENLTDPEGRKLRSLTRPNCVVGAATCGVTDGLKPVFEAGQEVERKDFVKGGAEDMVYFLTKERERAEEYQAFAREMLEFLAVKKKENPELRDYLDEMEGITREIIEAFEVEKDNIKDLDYARELANQTIALAQEKNPYSFAFFMKLKGEWTGMGGAIDDLNRELHTITRKLFQEAGYRAATKREAVKIAEEIRSRTRKCLRNPGSYEIWSDY